MTNSKAILDARALALAEAPTTDGQAAGLDILEFRLALETYGIESSYVREVYPLREFTALPGTPPFVLGITNVRGQIISIMDLQTYFGLAPGDESGPDLVIIVQSADMQVALLVDAVIGVRTMPSQDIQPSPHPEGIFAGANPAVGCAPYLLGVASAPGGYSVTLLDIAKLLADPRIIVDQEADNYLSFVQT